MNKSSQVSHLLVIKLITPFGNTISWLTDRAPNAIDQRSIVPIGEYMKRVGDIDE